MNKKVLIITVLLIANMLLATEINAMQAPMKATKHAFMPVFDISQKSAA